jgi:DNA invertase Pin-like site-specific DNA recombinase
MDAVIYLRVSTKEQAAKDEAGEGYSIPAQREACLRHIAERGWNLAGEFTDAGESARTADRPMLKSMLRRVAEGGIGAVVVHKIDRLARSMEDHVAIRAALRHAGVQLVSVTENIEETASGRLVEGIHALMAEFYSANLAGEIRKGMTQKAKTGGWPTKAPIGYLNVREKTAGKEIAKVVLDPERALLVREAFRLYATGDYSLPELQATMHAKGLTSPYAKRPGAPVSVSKLAELLTNPFYTGVVQWGGVRYDGQHKPLIPQSLFDRVQDTLRARDVAGVRERKHEHYLKGLLHCGECSRRLSLTLAKGRYLYFYCLGQRGSARTGCRQPYILAGDAETLVEDLYREIQLPPSWVSRLTEELEAEIVDRQAEASERRVVLTKMLAKLADERGKLLQAFYANAIPLDLLKAEQDRIGVAELAGKGELEATEGDLDGWQDVLRTAIRLAGNCHAAYLKARPSVRRRFNDAVLEAVYIKDRKIGRAEFSDVFAPLFSRPSSNKELKVEVGGIEPSKEWRTWFLTLETRPAASVILIMDERTCVR